MKAIAVLAMLLISVYFPATTTENTDESIVKIIGDDSFTHQNGVVAGNGSAENPYLITNLSCKSIWIENTTKHFVIFSLDLSDGSTGIFMKNVSNGRIFNVSIRNYSYGIYIDGCKNIIIENSSIEECGINGIYIHSSNNLTVKYSEFSEDNSAITLYNGISISIRNSYFNNCTVGMAILQSKNNIFAENTFIHCDEAVTMAEVEEHASGVDENVVLDNTIKSCSVGIRISDSLYNNVLSNDFVECSWGIYIAHGDSTKIIGNNFTDSEMIISSSTGIWIMRNNFRGCGVEIIGNREDNWNTHKIEDNLINGKPLVYITNSSSVSITRAGEIIVASSMDIVVDGVEIQNTSVAISIAFSENCTIKNSVIANCPKNGIFILKSKNSAISRNYIRNCGKGLDIHYSSSLDITKNIIYSCNRYALCLDSSRKNCIESNTLALSLYGIYMSDSSLNKIYNNSIYQNGIYGMYLDGECKRNEIYGNFFFENAIQARDDGSFNKWNSSEFGNFWSDYNSYDIDGDGILSGIYRIEGDAGAVDYLPLTNFPPTIKEKSANNFIFLLELCFLAIIVVCSAVLKWRERLQKSF